MVFNLLIFGEFVTIFGIATILPEMLAIVTTGALVRKSVVSIKFPPVILGPEMAAPILWAPGIVGLFLLEKKSFFRRGGGSANFILMGVGIFPS